MEYKPMNAIVPENDDPRQFSFIDEDGNVLPLPYHHHEGSWEGRTFDAYQYEGDPRIWYSFEDVCLAFDTQGDLPSIIWLMLPESGCRNDTRLNLKLIDGDTLFRVCAWSSQLAIRRAGIEAALMFRDQEQSRATTLQERIDMLFNALDRTPKTTPKWLEKDVEDSLCKVLGRDGTEYQRQVIIDVGRIDILTSKTIYEVKKYISLSTLNKTAGQLFVYQKSIMRSELVIVAGECFGDLREIRRKALKLGVYVQIVNPNLADQWVNP
jgi:hypothetical protein